MLEFELTKDRKYLRLVAWSLEDEKESVKSFFTKKSPNSDFNADVERGEWDGMDHFIDKYGRVPIGLWRELWNFSELYEIEVKFDVTSTLNKGWDKESYKNFVDKLFEGIKTDEGDPFYPRDYQYEGTWRALKYRYCCEELATSAGKTAIFYTYNSYLKHVGVIDKNNKAVLIVPNVMLVKQTAESFKKFYNGLVEWNICTIGGDNDFDQEKFDECDILITTYQSMLNLVPKCLDNKLGNLILRRIKKGEEEKRQNDIMNYKKKLNQAKIMDICSNFGVVNIDECLHPDTMITKSNGDIVKISEIQKGDIVKTINDKTFKFEDREVDYIYKNLSKSNQMYELELENGESIKITGNHKVKLISGEYKRVDNLTVDNEILSIYD